jgi:hypothetical protein
MNGKFIGFPKLISSAVDVVRSFGAVNLALLQKLSLDDRMSSWLAPTNSATQFGMKDLAAYFADVVRHDFNFQSSPGEEPFQLTVDGIDEFDTHLTFREFLERIASESKIVVPTRNDQDSLLRQEVLDQGTRSPRKPTAYSRIDEKLRNAITVPSDVHLYMLIIFVFSFKSYRQDVIPGDLNLNDPVRKYFPISRKNSEDLLTDFLQFVRIRAEQWSLGDPGCPNFSGGIVHLIGSIPRDGPTVLYPIPETILDLLEAINSRFGMMTGSSMRLNTLAQEFQRNFLPRPKTEFEDLLSEIEKSMPRPPYSHVTWDMSCEEVDGRLRLEFGHNFQRVQGAKLQMMDRHNASISSGRIHRCTGWSVGVRVPLTNWEQMFHGMSFRCARGPHGVASLETNGDHLHCDSHGWWVFSGSGIFARTDFYLCEEIDAQRDGQTVAYFISSEEGRGHVHMSESDFKRLSDVLSNRAAVTIELNRD